jgi:hypothetical protein
MVNLGDWSIDSDELTEEQKLKLQMAYVRIEDAAKEIAMSQRRYQDALRHYAEVAKEIQEAHETSN